MEANKFVKSDSFSSEHMKQVPPLSSSQSHCKTTCDKGLNELYLIDNMHELPIISKSLSTLFWNPSHWPISAFIP